MKRVLKAMASLMLMMVFVVGCTKPDEPNNGGNNGNNDSDVRVTTYTPQDITATTAKCGGDVIVTQGLSLNELGVCWGTERNPTVENFHLSTTNWSNPYVHTITNLEPSTNYYIRAFALRGLEYYYGEEKSFTTIGGELPTLTTSEVINIMKYTATGGGNITSDGGVPIIERGICWSVNSNPTIDDAHASCFDDIYNGGNIGLGLYNVEMTGLEQNTQYYVRAYAKNYYGISYGSQVSFTTLNPPPIGTYNGHDYIDLGLPSGTLWATCNVGATAPEDYGDHFAWGETEPKTTYEWDNYRYCVIVNGTVLLTKYCNAHGYGGYTDTLAFLQPLDDAATANWGNGWQLPTTDQWYELFENTSRTWVTQGGVYGALYTAANGNSLFLPAAGCRTGSHLHDQGEKYFYWSNKRTGSYFAWSWTVDRPSDMTDNHRYFGFSVRPVHSIE